MRHFYRFIVLIIVLLASMTFIDGCAARTVYVQAPPPAARVEVRPARPYPNAIWVPGHWTWRKGRYVWVAGYWVKARPGFVWVPGHWVKRPRGWVWVKGHWRKR